MDLASVFIDKSEKSCPNFTGTIGLMKNRPSLFGPWLKFKSLDGAQWQGSILWVLSDSISFKDMLVVTTSSVQLTISPQIIAGFYGYNVLRYDVSIRVSKNTTLVTYFFMNQPNTKHVFHAIGYQDQLRAASFSCHGLLHEYLDKGHNQLDLDMPWHDLMARHEDAPFHLLIGGGDQIYNDEIWHHCPALREWQTISDREERQNSPFTQEMAAQVTAFVFFHYLWHFSKSPFSKAMASIPYIFICDDHDLFDGFGSYPQHVQESSVFKGLGRILMDMYLLFQHHTTQARIDVPNDYSGEQDEYSADEYFGVHSHQSIRRISSQTLLCILDNRSERTVKRVMHRNTVWELKQRLRKELVSTKLSRRQHLLVVSPIPMIFPRMKAAERILTTVSRVKSSRAYMKTFRKARPSENGLFQFGEPELLDDLVDHWCSDRHIAERNDLITFFQSLAEEFSIRVSILAGDAHLCAAAKFYDATAMTRKARRHEKKCLLTDHAVNDPRFIFHLTSSAITNLPPPSKLSKAITLIDKTQTLLALPYAVGPSSPASENDSPPIPITVGVTVPLLPTGHPLRTDWDQKKFLRCRNWCIIEETPYEATQEVVSSQDSLSSDPSDDTLDSYGMSSWSSRRLQSFDPARVSLGFTLQIEEKVGSETVYTLPFIIPPVPVYQDPETQ